MPGFGAPIATRADAAATPGNDDAVMVTKLPRGIAYAMGIVAWNVPSVRRVIRRRSTSGISREIEPTSVSVTGTEAGAVPSTTIASRPVTECAVTVTEPLTP